MRKLAEFNASEFDDLRQLIGSDATIDQVVARVQGDPAAVRAKIETALAESVQTLRVLAGTQVPDRARLLEVGAGLGVTAILLSRSGFDVTALEPSGPGFEDQQRLAEALASIVGSDHQCLSTGAELLDPKLHGTFDLIYSNNVLEHVGDPHATLAAMATVLAPDGLSIHSCPNYSVPFEPHFGIPLIPARPQWTASFLPNRIRMGGLWQSLNFIRARDVDSAGRQARLHVVFRKGALASSLDRLVDDSEFRSRHRLIARLMPMLKATGVTTLVRRLPPRWSTPMTFCLYHDGLAEDAADRWLLGELED